MLMFHSMRARLLLGLAICLAAVLLFQPTFATPTQTGASGLPIIGMWTRAHGKHGSRFVKRPSHTRPQQIQIKAKDVTIKELRDSQYNKTHRYKVVPLAKLIAQYQPGPKEDLALLTFHNGVMIPYPLALTKPKLAKKYPVYVAVAIWSPKAKKWSTSFPPIHAKGKARFRDQRAIYFAQQKIVVPGDWHPVTVLRPDLHLLAAKTFKPWSFAGSLIGVEFVRKKQYYGQFQGTKTRQERKGLQLYRQICQFCHGVRGVGGKAAWDFVHPSPIYKRKGGFQLYYHIKFRSNKQIKEGAMMPGIRGMTIRDAFAIYNWLRGESKRAMAVYDIKPKKKKKPKKR